MKEELRFTTQGSSDVQGEPVFRLNNDVGQEVHFPFYFDESYFTLAKGSEDYNPQLATMSLVVAMSEFSHFREGVDKRYLKKLD